MTGSKRTPAMSLGDFPLQTFDKIRYGDTDRQGHVNNASFSQFLETGRAELLYDAAAPLAGAGKSFVIARLELDFLAEANWPGRIDIGTRVTAIGRSSLTLGQGLFQDGRCVATAKTVIVQVDDATHRSHPLPEATVQRLKMLQPA